LNLVEWNLAELTQTKSFSFPYSRSIVHSTVLKNRMLRELLTSVWFQWTEECHVCCKTSRLPSQEEPIEDQKLVHPTSTSSIQFNRMQTTTEEVHKWY
jgi:hypothetical protein